jgi:hypothetical protein
MTEGKLSLIPDIKEVLSRDLAKNPQYYAYVVWLDPQKNELTFKGFGSTTEAYDFRNNNLSTVSDDDKLVVKFTQLDEL